MKKYQIKETCAEAAYDYRRLDGIPSDLTDTSPITLSEHDTLEEGLAALAKLRSTANKVETTTRPIWSITIHSLVELEAVADGEWEPTGSEWPAQEEIHQPYAGADLDRTKTLAELAKRYGAMLYQGRTYHLLNQIDEYPADAICADDPIDPQDGTQQAYELTIEGGQVVAAEESGFITWDDDGSIRM